MIVSDRESNREGEKVCVCVVFHRHCVRVREEDTMQCGSDRGSDDMRERERERECVCVCSMSM